MRTSFRTPPPRVDPAVVALRWVAAESVPHREALDQLDEAGGCGGAVQVAGEIREARDRLTMILGRLVALVRDGGVAGG